MPKCSVSHEWKLDVFNPPIPISDHLWEEDWQRLALHFFQGDNLFDFAMSMHLKEGTSAVKKSKRVSYLDAVKSTWESLTSNSSRPFAAVPYCTSGDVTSTWACIDVDNHQSSSLENSHALWVAKKLIAYLRKVPAEALEGTAFIIEQSGRGFHFFLISATPKPSEYWIKYMRTILRKSGLDEKADSIELFPVSSGKRKGVRLPGSANPNTWCPHTRTYKVSELIAVSGLPQLLDSIPSLKELSSRFNKRGSSLLLKPKNETRSDTPAPWRTHVDAVRLLEKHAIKAVATRRTRLSSLVGDGIHHFGKPVLWEIAHEQYRRAKHRCQSDLQTHREDFESLFAGMMDEVIGRFAPTELTFFKTLKTDSRRTTFLIAWNFAKLAQGTKRFGPDGRFPLSGLDLSCRQQRGIRSAYNDRNALIEAGCIRKVSPYLAGKKAEYFVWMLDDHG